MTAEIIPHNFGRRVAPEEVPGDFPACLEREKWRGGEPCDHRRGPFSLLEAEGMAQCACGEKVTLLHVFKLLATAENQQPEAAPGELPEPAATVSATDGGILWGSRGALRTDAAPARLGPINLYTEQQVRDLLAAHGIGSAA